ncbi:MAG: M14 family metallopeptidase [Thermoguttaceae bacterium]
MVMAILTAPQNHKRLDRYRDISRRLTLAQGLDDHQALKLAAEGKAIVWIDGGLHGIEVLGAQQLIETVYQLVSRNDPETQRLLRDVVVLCCCPNPDGLDLVADWYMREPDAKKRSTGNLPTLYQKYIGHDNNRDFIMVTQKETEAVCRVQYQQWFPQIVYNHHQSGPAGTVMFAPPFRDPFNYNFDPLVPLGIDLVGAAMHGRFAAEGKPGVTMRKTTGYSTWWNGGLRTTAYFHNMIGLLTETIGHPTPIEIPLQLARQLPSADLPYPIAPHSKWHFRQSVDYCLTANWAVLDVASRHREQLLMNAYRMGKNSIDRGSRDCWTIHPDRIEVAEKALQKAEQEAAEKAKKEASEKTQPPAADKAPEPKADNSAKQTPAEKAPDDPAKKSAEKPAEKPAQKSPEPTPEEPAKKVAAETPAPGQQGEKPEAQKMPDIFTTVLHDPAHRDPRGYILPSDQPDFPTATRFVNALLKTGVTVHRMTARCEVAGKSYPEGSYVILAAQAFRPHILDLFEPQDHPDDIPYPGGPPPPPNDNAGWTLAYQMGVGFDRILEGFSGPFEPIEGLARPPVGAVPKPDSSAAYLLDRAVNDSFVAVNRLLAAKCPVQSLEQPVQVEGKTWPAGTWCIPNSAQSLPLLRQAAEELGLDFVPTPSPFQARLAAVAPRRVALVDRYGGSMDAGWTRWVLEQFRFDLRVVYPPDLDQDGLKDRFDVLILVGGMVPDSLRSGVKPPDEKSIPQEYRGRSGSITADKTLPQLKAFLEAGGTIVTIGSSTSLARHLGIQLPNALTEMGEDGRPRPLPSEKFFVPGSVLRVRLDQASPLAAGMPEQVDIFFRKSPAFRLSPQAVIQGVRPIAWFDTDRPLRSGWAWGQAYLEGAVAVAEAPVGKGVLILCGPEITLRAQAHGTFKLLFNGIYRRPGAAP